MQLRRRPIPSHDAKINVTPLIDVVMVLIVFYLIVGQLATDRQARLNLPSSAVGLGEAQRPALIIHMIAPVAPGTSPQLIIDGKPLALPALEALLLARFPSAADSQPTIHIRADRTLDFASIRPVLSACRNAGLTSVKLVTSRSTGGGVSNNSNTTGSRGGGSP
jgi:biopolymer transport protein ExbD